MKTTSPVILNLGCGERKIDGFINVDKYGDPDLVHDLDVFPYPWIDNSVDEIFMIHVLEHLDDWWGCFIECARILKPGGRLNINVPDYSSFDALTYRDHKTVFSVLSFHGILGARSGANSWAILEEGKVPLVMESYNRIPHKKYNWMFRFPFILKFCADHLYNFIHEQRFVFVKV